jgi:hypothetical protein
MPRLQRKPAALPLDAPELFEPEVAVPDVAVPDEEPEVAPLLRPDVPEAEVPEEPLESAPLDAPDVWVEPLVLPVVDVEPLRPAEPVAAVPEAPADELPVPARVVPEPAWPLVAAVPVEEDPDAGCVVVPLLPVAALEPDSVEPLLPVVIPAGSM